MNEIQEVLGEEDSEYNSREKHNPLLDLQFKKGLVGTILKTIAFGAAIAWVLINAGHGWWALIPIALALFAIGQILMDFTVDRVRIFNDGVLATRLQIPWNGKPVWSQYPWSAVLHLDLSDRHFRIATTKNSSYYGGVVSYMGKMERTEKTKLSNELKSLQQRGDIPSTVRIVE